MTKRLLAVCAALMMTICAATAQTTHTIAAGETLYRLSKNYGVSAEAICAANPGLSADNFKAGAVIFIPAVTAETAVVAKHDDVPMGKCAAMHEVAKKETLYSIARRYNVTVDQLVEANGLKDREAKLKKGILLCIPYPVRQPVVEKEPSNEELMPKVPSVPKRHINMAVVLPFKAGDNRSTHMLEFYRGVLMAVDSIKHRGISVDLHAIESGTTAADMRFVLASHPELKNMDFIIGPQSTEQIAAMSDFSKENKVRLVVPFASQCENVKSNPWLYTVTAQKSYMENAVPQLAEDVFPDHNVIVMHVEGESADNRALVNRITARFTAKGQRIHTIDAMASEESMLAAFNQFRENLVLVPAGNEKALNRFFPVIDGFMKAYPEYRVSVMGFPEWQGYTSGHLSDFYSCNTYVCATYFRNPLGSATSAFERRYAQWARKPMAATTPQFGLMGFDVAYYFLLGVSRHGAGLETHHGDMHLLPFQHAMCFSRVSNWGGFVNKSIKFIHYKPSQTIELLESNR